MNMPELLQFSCLPFHQLSLAELYRLMRLRQMVFVLEQNCPYVDADGKDHLAHHLMGKDAEGRLQACARLLPPGAAYPAHASIGRVVTSAAVRGQGQGQALMREAIAECSRLFGPAPIKISAQCYLIRFYEGFGFATQEESYLEDDIPHIAMVREGTVS